MGFFDNNTELNIGDKVRVKYRNQEGYIIDKNGNLYMVSLNDGGYIDSYTANQKNVGKWKIDWRIKWSFLKNQAFGFP